MSNYAIKVENLGKRYRLIDAASQADKLENLWDYIALPWRRFKEIRSLTTFSDDDEDKIFWALQDINFELKQGEVLGIIGRNGAGKSTLLKILSRITSPTTGKVKINGRVNSLLEVGTGFNGSLTGRENIYMNGTIHGMSKKEIDSKIEEIAEFAGLAEGFLDIPVKRYSSGMKVRLGFAVAAHLEPEILIVDEVLAVGDAQFKRKCMGKMGDVTRQGRTVILVSHAMENIEQLCDRAIWLEEGRIVDDGDAATIVRKYIDSFRSETQKLKLWDRDDRDGTADYKFNDYYFSDFSGNKKNIIKSGDEFRVNFEVAKNGIKNINEAYVGFNLRDTNGKNIFTCSSMRKGKTFPLTEKTHTISFDIPKLQLNQGIYYMDLVLIHYVGGKLEVIDRLKEGVELNVQFGNYHNVDVMHVGEGSFLMYVDFEMGFDKSNEVILNDEF